MLLLTLLAMAMASSFFYQWQPGAISRRTCARCDRTWSSDRQPARHHCH